MARQFLQAIEHAQITGHLWIVEMGRIRIHQSNDDDW